MAHCLLIQPEGLVGEAIPDFGKKPPDGVAAPLKAARKRDGIAKSRRVPEDQFAAVRSAGEDIVGSSFRNVRPVSDFAYVAHQKRARECCLSNVGMAHKTQMNSQRIRRKGHVVAKQRMLF